MATEPLPPGPPPGAPAYRLLHLLEPQRPARVRESRTAWALVVATVCLGAFIGQLDASIVTVALPHIGADLHVSPAAASWVSLVYLVTLVGLVTPVGLWADAVGRKALYVNRGFTTRINGIPRDESDGILRILFEHMENPLFQCRFRWTENAVAFWDNRCTQHRAMWDYWPHTRYGNRVTVKGDRPV